MKSKFVIALVLIISSCHEQTGDFMPAKDRPKLQGTWKLLTGTLIEKGDTTVTDYTKNESFIKIINDTHFAFLRHDVNNGGDSASAFGAGGGSYIIKDSLYTEHLEYCSDREWEGNDFTFTVIITGDTLVQSGIEKVEGTDINRLNIEKYVRMKE